MLSVIWWWTAGRQPVWGRGIGWPRLKVLQVPDEGVLPNEHLCGYVVYDGYTMMSLEGLCVYRCVFLARWDVTPWGGENPGVAI